MLRNKEPQNSSSNTDSLTKKTHNANLFFIFFFDGTTKPRNRLNRCANNPTHTTQKQRKNNKTVHKKRTKTRFFEHQNTQANTQPNRQKNKTAQTSHKTNKQASEQVCTDNTGKQGTKKESPQATKTGEETT